MDISFNFNTDDCIRARKAVIQFCNSCLPFNGKSVVNCIDDKEPYKDVLSDFQTIMYIQFICIGINQAQQAHNELPMRHKSKQLHSQMLRCMQMVKQSIPFNDLTFVSLYSDVDDVIYDKLNTLATQIYYTISNSMLKHTENAKSEQVHALARLTVGFIFAEMGITWGFKHAHNLDTRRLVQLPNSMMRLTSAIIHEQQKRVMLDEAQLDKTVNDAILVVANTANPILEAVAEYAETLDLTAYVDSAEVKLTRMRELIAARKKAEKKVVTNLKRARL